MFGFMRRAGAQRARVRNMVSETLRGKVGENPVWADRAVRDHAIRAILRHFGDDERWALQLALVLYDARTTAQIDRIISEHILSRNEWFDPEAWAGAGWNPADAMWFLGDRAEFWRIYRALNETGWFSVDRCLNPQDHWRRSGYEVRGVRDCVHRLTLKAYGDTSEDVARAGIFTGNATTLIAAACGATPPPALFEAIAGRAAYTSVIGPVLAEFSFTWSPQDWTMPPQSSFQLRLVWTKP